MWLSFYLSSCLSFNLSVRLSVCLVYSTRVAKTSGLRVGGMIIIVKRTDLAHLTPERAGGLKNALQSQ